MYVNLCNQVLAGRSHRALDFRCNRRYAHISFEWKGVIKMSPPEDVCPEIFAALCATQVDVPKSSLCREGGGPKKPPRCNIQIAYDRAQ
jgi:hypothetical protein